jgi:hypothetical protein
MKWLWEGRRLDVFNNIAQQGVKHKLALHNHKPLRKPKGPALNYFIIFEKHCIHTNLYGTRNSTVWGKMDIDDLRQEVKILNFEFLTLSRVKR